MIKVLIVEDEEIVVNLLAAILSQLMDYTTFYATTGLKAVEIARANHPDIILLDIRLPDITGYEVCRLLKSNPATSPIKIIMLSGMPQDSEWQIAQDAGADDYITKPFSATSLLEKIENIARAKQEKTWNIGNP